MEEDEENVVEGEEVVEEKEVMMDEEEEEEVMMEVMMEEEEAVAEEENKGTKRSRRKREPKRSIHKVLLQLKNVIGVYTFSSNLNSWFIKRQMPEEKNKTKNKNTEISRSGSLCNKYTDG